MKHETEILEALRKRFGDGYEVDLHRSTKTNNQIQEGVVIRQESEDIGVCIYFKDILAEMETETTEMFLKAMVDKIFSTYIENHEKAPKDHAAGGIKGAERGFVEKCAAQGTSGHRDHIQICD